MSSWLTFLFIVQFKYQLLIVDLPLLDTPDSRVDASGDHDQLIQHRPQLFFSAPATKTLYLLLGWIRVFDSRETFVHPELISILAPHQWNPHQIHHLFVVKFWKETSV